MQCSDAPTIEAVDFSNEELSCTVSGLILDEGMQALFLSFVAIFSSTFERLLDLKCSQYV